MPDESQPANQLQDVQDIKRMMEKSSRFFSLSGLSGIAAGVCALVGAAIARYVIFAAFYRASKVHGGFSPDELVSLKWKLLLLAVAVFAVAALSSFYLTWKKSSRQGMSLWSLTSRRLFWNMAIPVGTGAIFILGMLQHNDWRFVSSACLIFYGLALVNASKYTFTDVRYLGFCEIILGLLNMQWIGYGLYFWALGFGVLHILYGIVMWRKYERKAE